MSLRVQASGKYHVCVCVGGGLPYEPHLFRYVAKQNAQNENSAKLSNFVVPL
jgi:hypothetical protein